ncbi:hypothetical protein AAFF_G00368920 [Aldrovandia affinis]|uniref:Uncharacterized protein n=1 Tax=Aldrovandia affinis TaxID=143900 RepID=A0AAD7WMP4_9TELE|nr:hypothetical protein AAFF_G00368920 [Aldrovandia affinis]
MNGLTLHHLRGHGEDYKRPGERRRGDASRRPPVQLCARAGGRAGEHTSKDGSERASELAVMSPDSAIQPLSCKHFPFTDASRGFIPACLSCAESFQNISSSHG